MGWNPPIKEKETYVPELDKRLEDIAPKEASYKGDRWRKRQDGTRAVNWVAPEKERLPELDELFG
jgi:hypothetical protein